MTPHQDQTASPKYLQSSPSEDDDDNHPARLPLSLGLGRVSFLPMSFLLSSDGEDEEYLGDAVGPGVGSLSKGKGKSADWKDDNNTGGLHMGDLTLIKSHKESMLQTRLALQSSSMIYKPLPILGTPKKKAFLPWGTLERKLHTSHGAMA